MGCQTVRNQTRFIPSSYRNASFLGHNNSNNWQAADEIFLKRILNCKPVHPVRGNVKYLTDVLLGDKLKNMHREQVICLIHG